MTDLERLVKKLVEVLLTRDPTGVHRPVTIADLRHQILPYRTHRAALGIMSVEDYELLILRLVAEEGEYVRTNPPSASERAKKELATPNPNIDLVDEFGAVTIQIGAPSLARIAELDPGPRIEPMRGLPLILMPEPKEPEAGFDLDVEPEPPDLPGPGPLSGPRLVSDHDERWAPPPPIELMPPMPAPPPPPPPVQPAPPPRIAIEPPEVPQFDALEPVDREAPSRPRGCAACEAVLPVGREVIFCPFCGFRVGAAQCSHCGTSLEPAWRHCITCGKPTGPKPVA